MTDPIIITQDVERSFTMSGYTLHVLKGISVTVARGEWIALCGPSGSGKSTLLGIIGGIDLPTSGQVWLDNTEISGLPESKLARIRNQKIGFVFQSFHLIPTMTALENVELPLYINPQRRQSRRLAEEALEMVGLADRRKHLPQQLSGGEQQRVAISRALVTRPDLLLADEPTGNLDSVNSQQIMDLLTNLRHHLDLTIVMVTHDPQAASSADRKLDMVDGRVVSHQIQLSRNFRVRAEVAA